MRRDVGFLGRGVAGLKTSVAVDGSNSRVHRRFASFTRQQVDIISFLETDRPVESKFKTRIRLRLEEGS